jgi:hypothetical protein
MHQHKKNFRKNEKILEFSERFLGSGRYLLSSFSPQCFMVMRNTVMIIVSSKFKKFRIDYGRCFPQKTSVNTIFPSVPLQQDITNR